MNEEELHKLFHRIELDKSSDSCGFEFADSFNCTFDNIATCYDDRLKLYNLVKQLQNNWNELKYIVNNTFYKLNGILDRYLLEKQMYIDYGYIRNKMQELEQGKDD